MLLTGLVLLIFTQFRFFSLGLYQPRYYLDIYYLIFNYWEFSQIFVTNFWLNSTVFKLIYFLNKKLNSISLFVCIHMHECHSICVEVKGQVVGVDSLLRSCGSNWGHQICQHALLSTEPSRWPKECISYVLIFFFKVTKVYFWCNTFGVNIACKFASWSSAVVDEGSCSCL